MSNATILVEEKSLLSTLVSIVVTTLAVILVAALLVSLLWFVEPKVHILGSLLSNR
jgi:hypothetical protein